ncbi:dolichol-phosphate mannosyltransferase subunit 3 [Scaptodrosophila lebanonensis]|uniref:Dolichol-phosphate mannosyltransferase subunit 3 n=1 Tax=Drosophila lebanonensis TaxID=7225 RepID=A0A6J2T290_DROLE|nr:dolichol-phosphate mannosyltransferase subunit 3 [Scaptodrosophila lebanonensis]
MTNLQRWLFYAALFAVPYLAIVLGSVQTPLTTKYFLHIQLLPLLLLVLFGLYSAFTVLYRTFTFNDCPEAAKELQAEIIEARKDLIAKGFKFRD